MEQLLSVTQTSEAQKLQERPHQMPDSTDRAVLNDPQRHKLLSAAIDHLFVHDAEFERFALGANNDPSDQVDFLLAVEDETHDPDGVFGQLRWGGQFIYVSRDRERVESLAERYRQRGFLPIHNAVPLRLKRWGLRLRGWSPRAWCFVARKVFIIRPREISERFTYHVQLVPRHTHNGGFVVMKEIPSLERVIGRLRARFTDLPFAVIERRALNFTEKVFPLFLTREAAMLKVLERDLPREYAHRVPHVLGLEKDHRGYVQRLWMNWLRNSGPALSQMEFARQFAELLYVLHDKAGVVHLDLRMDNIVISGGEVGFVDFGSSVRLGENIAGNTLLSTLFEELMRTSQIQRMLERMTKTGSVTSAVLREGYGKVDKAVDLFYMAMQISAPTGNPDLRGLIKWTAGSPEANALSRLRREILRPPDSDNPTYRTAHDILEGIERLEHDLRTNRPMKTIPLDEAITI
jgi:hypothetical protein